MRDARDVPTPSLRTASITTAERADGSGHAPRRKDSAQAGNAQARHVTAVPA